MGYKYIKFSEVGFEKRINEDAVEVTEIEEGVLAILCDGVGGDYGGDLASKIAIKSAVYFFSTLESDDYLQRIKNVFNETNSFIIAHSSGSESIKSMATTMEILFLKDNVAFWGHLGDSRIYQFKADKIKQISKDHSLVQKLLDEGFISHQQASKHPNKNIILKALGDNPFIQPDISKIKLNEFEDNRFFICSDGISNVISDREIEQIFNTGDMELKKNTIVDLVKKRGAPDDYSFIYIERDK